MPFITITSYFPPSITITFYFSPPHYLFSPPSLYSSYLYFPSFPPPPPPLTPFPPSTPPPLTPFLPSTPPPSFPPPPHFKKNRAKSLLKSPAFRQIQSGRSDPTLFKSSQSQYCSSVNSVGLILAALPCLITVKAVCENIYIF